MTLSQRYAAGALYDRSDPNQLLAFLTVTVILYSHLPKMPWTAEFLAVV